jgi:TolB-like protein/Tfp pilus assembly protein PilF
VVYRFGDYSLDSARRELWCGSGLVAVEPQVFDVLQFLLCNRQRVVSKDDLIAAVWAGRIVSESTLNSRITAVRHAIGDSADEQRFIKTLPRKGVRFVGAVREDEEATRIAASSNIIEPSRAVLTIPDKPSIAVLPFTNMSGDSDQEYFADGMVEEIIMALSRFRQLFVIARNSSFAYKGRAVDVKQVGRELGVRYILEGSVRKAGNRVRISGQLIDTATGAHLWADRFDGSLEDIFELQDQITTSVVGAIAPKLEQAEIDRAKRKLTESLDAYDHYLRGIASFNQWTREANAEALWSFSKAIELDPSFASAYAWAARCYAQRKTYGRVTDRMQEVAEAERLARRAVQLGNDDAVALCFGGWALARVVGDLDTGAVLIARALVLNPNLAAAWYCSGWVKVFLGQPEEAIKHLAYAIRLSPFDPLSGYKQVGIATAHLFAGRYDEASSWAEMALGEQPIYVTALLAAAASHALAGRLKQAQKAIERLHLTDPTLTVSNLGDRLPLRRQEDIARWAEGLRLAGLPE